MFLTELYRRHSEWKLRKLGKSRKIERDDVRPIIKRLDRRLRIQETIWIERQSVHIIQKLKPVTSRSNDNILS